MDLLEKTAIVQVLAPDADAFAGTPTIDIIDMANYRSVTFVFVHAVGVTGTSKITIEECDDNAASNSTAIPFSYRLSAGMTGVWGALTAVTAATGYTTVAGSNKVVAITIDAADLADGFPFVRLVAVEVANDPVDGCVYAILTNRRYGQATGPGVV